VAKLTLDHADLELSAFEPPPGTTTLREFIDERWGGAAPGAQEGARRPHVLFPLGAERVQAPEQPCRPDPEPAARRHRASAVRPRGRRWIIAAQPELRDRVALKLLFLIGIRKGSLAQLRLKDFDLGRRRVRVHTKGSKIRNLPLPTEELRQELQLLLGRDSNEYLLFPEVKAPRWLTEAGLRRGQGRDRSRSWYRCLQRAGVVEPGQTEGMKMHAARCTAGTEFYLATGDIRATQQLLGHRTSGRRRTSTSSR
jgi:integrase